MSDEMKNREEAETRESHAEERSHHSHRSEHRHGAHHHQHAHHHSKHRRKKKKSKPIVLPKFMKKKKFWINMGIIVGAIVLLTLVGVLANRSLHGTETHSTHGTTGASRGSGDMVHVSVTFFDEEVPLVGDAVEAVLEADPDQPVEDALKPFREEGVRLDYNLPVALSYDVSGLGSSRGVLGATLEVSESSDFRQPRVFELGRHTRTIKVDQLKTGTQYFYRFRIHLTHEDELSVQGSFRTKDTPRILSVEGLVNVRDIGGWKTADGKKLRQGMIYRGSEMDGAVEPDYSLTAKGLEDMLLTFGIRKDLDLRASTDNAYGSDALGAGVEHIYYGMAGYEGIFSDWGKRQMKALCEVLAEEENYPVYIHCTYGMDRTGTVCYLLEALLGVEEDDLLRDYRLSALYHINLPEQNLQPFLAELEKLPGKTLQEKAEHYFLSAGVTADEIAEIKRIMLESFASRC